jgi:hypothetical protein
LTRWPRSNLTTSIPIAATAECIVSSDARGFAKSHSGASPVPPSSWRNTPSCWHKENAAVHVGATLSKPGSIDALIIKYQKHDAFTKELSEVTQATRRRILNHFRDFKTPSGKRYGDARYSTMIDADINAVLKGNTPLAQDGWMKLSGT